jgi:hypothetical protein
VGAGKYILGMCGSTPEILGNVIGEIEVSDIGHPEILKT